MGAVEDQPATSGDPDAAGVPRTLHSDAYLVAQFRGGIDAAFAALVDRHGTSLYRFLLAMVHDEVVAEELAQAALVKAARRIDQLLDGQAFMSWLLAVARTTALDHLRARHPERHRPLDEAPVAVSSSDAEVVLDVRRVMARISSDDREVLLAADLLQLSMEELAEALEIAVSAAKMRVQRARARFRASYDGPSPRG